MPSIPALLLAASASAVSQADPVQPLAASSKWTVEYADNSCNIGKSFGASSREVKLWLRLLPGRANTQLLIEENRDGPPSFRKGDLVITPAPGKPFTVAGRNGSVKAGTNLTLGGLRAEDVAAMESADTLTFSYRRQTLKLTGVNLKGALAAVRTCEDDLLTSWGVNLTEYRKITTPPLPVENPANWMSASDYPARTLAAGRSGQVLVRLDIAATGQTTQCTIIASSLIPELDEATCAGLMKCARFTPARTDDGNTASAISFLSFRWLAWDTWE